MRLIPARWFPLGVLLVLAACTGGRNTAIGPHNPLADSADQIVFGARSKMTDGGVSKSDLYADTAYFFDDNTRIEMRGHVTVTFYTEVGAKNAVLTALAGTYNNRTGNMEARGNVVVNTVDGRHLLTPILRYTQSKNEIASDTTFTTTDSTRRLTGIGFTSDPNMDNVHCFRACSGLGGQVILPSSSQPGGAAAPGSAPVASPPANAVVLPPSSAAAAAAAHAPPPEPPLPAGGAAPVPAPAIVPTPVVPPKRDSTRHDSTRRDSTRRDSARHDTASKTP